MDNKTGEQMGYFFFAGVTVGLVLYVCAQKWVETRLTVSQRQWIGNIGAVGSGLLWLGLTFFGLAHIALLLGSGLGSFFVFMTSDASTSMRWK